MLEDDHHIMMGEFVTTTSMVNVDGARVAYRLHGRGPAVVLVNGTAALDAHWGPVIGELSKYRTVISLDYSGSGDTTDDGSALSLQKLARQVREVARAAGADRFDLVGHSLGAPIAIQLAASSADLVRSLIGVAGFWGGAEPRLKLQFELWLDLLRTNRDRISQAAPALRTHAGVCFERGRFNDRRHDQGVHASRQLGGDYTSGRTGSGCRCKRTSQKRYKPHACNQLCSRSDRHADTRASRAHSRPERPPVSCLPPARLRATP